MPYYSTDEYDAKAKPRRLEVSDELETIEGDLTNVHGHGGLLERAQHTLVTRECTVQERRAALEACADALHQAAHEITRLAKTLR